MVKEDGAAAASAAAAAAVLVAAASAVAAAALVSLSTRRVIVAAAAAARGGCWCWWRRRSQCSRSRSWQLQLGQTKAKRQVLAPKSCVCNQGERWKWCTLKLNAYLFNLSTYIFVLFVCKLDYLHNFIVSTAMQRHELCSQKAVCIRILKLIFDEGIFSLISKYILGQSILFRAILNRYP